VTGTEIAFLAIGLILGIAAGAALIATLRSRTPTAREVRITMAPDAVPRRRAATLANDAFTDSPVAVDPARFGPADRAAFNGASSTNGTSDRTPVLDPRPGTVVEPAFRLVDPSADGHGAGAAPPNRLVVAQAMPVSTGIDPMLTALRASAAASAEAALRASDGPGREAADRELVAAGAVRTAVAVAGHSPIDPGGDDEPAGSTASTTVASAPRTGTTTRTRRNAAGAAAAAASSTAMAPSRVPTGASTGGPCGDARRLADERCELATRARGQATEAEEAHRAAQRAYDDHEISLVKATSDADPRAIREAKDQAQARFRAARAVARTQEDTESAARDWLHEINRINAMSAEASATLQRLRDGAPGFAVRLERAGLEADGARVAAEAAESACVAARQALADCEERSNMATPAPTAIEGGGGDPVAAGGDSLADALRSGASPRIVRLLRGDRGAMQDAVAALGRDDPTERRRWQVALSDLIDAILADAIASSALEYPTDHPFWGPFNRQQSRDITGALASLGYRFDGLGGWVDGRYPSQRDLSLAMGYAGLDPMRMRQWPNDAETAELFSDVQVAAAEHLAGAAGDMSLGSLVAMLGRRADGLTEIWNAWGRVRPVLLDES
jgi:hypothetical protein